MSTAIEFQSVAFRTTVDDLAPQTRATLVEDFDCNEVDYNCPGYLLITQHGDNRTFDHEGRLARNWTLHSCGDHDAVMSDILDCAKSVARETTRLHNSAHTLPHNYVKRHYEILRAALPLHVAIQEGLIESIALHTAWGGEPRGATVREAFPGIMASLKDSPFSKLAEYLIDNNCIKLESLPHKTEMQLVLNGAEGHAELSKAFLLMFLVARRGQRLNLGGVELTVASKYAFSRYGTRNALSAISGRLQAA